MSESSSENQGGHEVPMAGAQTEDGKVLIVGPDGMAVEGPPRADDGRPRRTALGDRAGRAARQGDADRQHDPAAARGGEGRSAGRGLPAAPEGDPRRLDQGAGDRAWLRSWSRSWNGSASTSPRTARRPRPSCGSRRPSWSAGWRACSTASRPRCSPSRWPLASSSSRCVAPCPAASQVPPDERRSRLPQARRQPGQRRTDQPHAAACTSRAVPSELEEVFEDGGDTVLVVRAGRPRPPSPARPACAFATPYDVPAHASIGRSLSESPNAIVSAAGIPWLGSEIGQHRGLRHPARGDLHQDCGRRCDSRPPAPPTSGSICASSSSECQLGCRTSSLAAGSASSSVDLRDQGVVRRRPPFTYLGSCP